jgi:hypothetical protein
MLLTASWDALSMRVSFTIRKLNRREGPVMVPTWVWSSRADDWELYRTAMQANILDTEGLSVLELRTENAAVATGMFLRGVCCLALSARWSASVQLLPLWLNEVQRTVFWEW